MVWFGKKKKTVCPKNFEAVKCKIGRLSNNTRGGKTLGSGSHRAVWCNFVKNVTFLLVLRQHTKDYVSVPSYWSGDIKVNQQ